MLSDTTVLHSLGCLKFLIFIYFLAKLNELFSVGVGCHENHNQLEMRKNPHC